MSSNKKDKSVADEAARTRKMLAKNEPVKISALSKANAILGQGPAKELGEHAVVVIMMNNIHHQLTLSRPIGITDLDGDDWVFNRTEDVPGLLQRREDPSAGEINQLRAQLRSKLACDAGVLVKREIDNRTEYMYPHRGDMSRNAILNDARKRFKDGKHAFDYPSDAEPSEKQRLNAEFRRYEAAGYAQFLDATTAAAEQNYISFVNEPEVVNVIHDAHPTTFRTLGGPYGDTEQSANPKMKGKPLHQVVNQLARDLVTPPDVGGGGTPPGEDQSKSGLGSSSTAQNVDKPQAVAVLNKYKGIASKLFGTGVHPPGRKSTGEPPANPPSPPKSDKSDEGGTKPQGKI